MKRKTAYIIGAGTSKEVNLPTGYELKIIIPKPLDVQFDWSEQKSGDIVIVNSLRESVKNQMVVVVILILIYLEAKHI